MDDAKQRQQLRRFLGAWAGRRAPVAISAIQAAAFVRFRDDVVFIETFLPIAIGQDRERTRRLLEAPLAAAVLAELHALDTGDRAAAAATATSGCGEAVESRGVRRVKLETSSIAPSPHLMVFDSSALIRSLIEELLEEERYHAAVSTFLPESFDQIATVQPALLIIDLGFEEQVGWDLLERLARDARTRRIPVLVTSTIQTLLDCAEAAQGRFGGQSWIVKPFEIEALMSEVRRLTALV